MHKSQQSTMKRLEPYFLSETSTKRKLQVYNAVIRAQLMYGMVVVWGQWIVALPQREGIPRIILPKNFLLFFIQSAISQITRLKTNIIFPQTFCRSWSSIFNFTKEW